MRTSDVGEIRKGDRVQLHPATDLWMQGDRYGTVTRVLKSTLHRDARVQVRTDHGRSVRLHPADILEVV